MTLARRDRFAFGENWAQFLSVVDERRISEAERSLTEMLGLLRLDGMRFCDVGCGSGLFSLAAWRLGAEVHSFDVDAASVACTEEMRRRFAHADGRWTIERGSALDGSYIDRIGRWDIVYSWGVLHHTGAMWRAMDLVARLVEREGILYIALYNDQGWQSRLWWFVKRTHNRLPRVLRFVIVAPAALLLWGPKTIRDMLRGRPFASWKHYSSTRGMSAWHDLIDWVGGFPYEVARPDRVIAFYERLGFTLRKQVRRTGLGCNEFVLMKDAGTPTN
jgi:2-polyprenyl-3-methyl-5-hydroxy-6-metoxy-1,4-benzoquinol methylase